MGRKSIPPETQKSVLLNSRRRCCLCFWLDGVDEVRKGQIAHLDQNNENAAPENLVFLCLEHHDQYDGKTSTSKGLREDEVREWRDELYKEMEYRFRSAKRRTLKLSIKCFKLITIRHSFNAVFRLQNTGEVSVRTPTISIRLPRDVLGEIPRSDMEKLLVNINRMRESQQDLFEPNGRVGIIKPCALINPVLMPGHSTDFHGVVFKLSDCPPGSAIRLEYRIDAEEMTPVLGEAVGSVPDEVAGFLRDE